MPEQEKDNIYYGAANFERYHSGKMTELEMHALEKAALEDPFLSDALDGYKYTPTALQDVEELKERLGQKEKKKKASVITLKSINPLLRIAAVLILVAGIAWAIIKNNTTKKEEIASVTEKKRDNKIAPDNVDKKTDSALITNIEETDIAETNKGQKGIRGSSKTKPILIPQKNNEIATAPVSISPCCGCR